MAKLDLYLDDFELNAVKAALDAVPTKAALALVEQISGSVTAPEGSSDKLLGLVKVQLTDDEKKELRTALKKGRSKAADYYQDTVDTIVSRITTHLGETAGMAEQAGVDRKNAWTALDRTEIERLIDTLESAVSSKTKLQQALQEAGYSAEVDYEQTTLYYPIWEEPRVSGFNAELRQEDILSSQFFTLYALEPERVERLPNMAPFLFVGGRVGNTTTLVITPKTPQHILDRQAEPEEPELGYSFTVRDVLEPYGYQSAMRGHRDGEFWCSEYRSKELHDDCIRILTVRDDGAWSHRSVKARVDSDGTRWITNLPAQVLGNGNTKEEMVEHLNELYQPSAKPKM